jgi:DNA-binding NtrC family response regulator
MFKNNILVVDDDRLICWGLEKLISARDFHVTTVNNWKDAIFEIYNVPYASVFLDINLPDINGMEVLHEIKKVAPGTKVVVMTADDTLDYKQQALDGAAHLLRKPFNIPEIEHIIDSISGNGQARRGLI